MLTAVRTAVGPLRHREFAFLFSAQAVSNTGDTFTYVALPFAVLALTKSVADVGYVLSAQVVGMAAFLLLGGVWADRTPRRSVLLAVSSWTRGASQACVAILLLTGTAHVWELVALMGFYGVSAATFYPAMTGLVPQTVPSDDLQRANALLSFTRSASVVIGPAIAGALVATVGPGWAIGVDALSFGLSAVLITAARIGGSAPASASQGTITELRQGWHEVRSRPWLWRCIAQFSVFQFAGLAALYVLGPVTAARHLGGASAWGILLAVAGAGSLAGDLAALKFEPRRMLMAASLAILMCIPALALLAVVVPLAWLAAAFFAYGAGLSFGDTMWFTALQQHVPAESLSRVSAYDWLGSVALRPLGQIVIGPLAVLIGVRSALAGAAGLVTVAILLAARSPSIRQLRRVNVAAAVTDPPSADQPSADH